MREVYVYDEFCNDFDNLGLVGALTPTSCEHEEIAGGMSEVILVHPIDETGKYKALEKGRIIKAIVPVRTTPEIDGTTVVTTVEKWHVDPLSTKAQRKVWSKRTDGKKLGSLKANDKVIVVKRNNSWDRYKIKAKKLNGWFDKTALVFEAQETLDPNDPTAIEDIYPLWGDKEQLFRIYSEDRSDTEITVHARHISYDLLTNMTMYKNNEAVTLANAVNGVLNQCVDSHDFTVQTNVADERTGVDYRHNNPINALFDPEEGILKRWDVQLVRDDYELTILKTVGKNRGMSIEYGRNLTGVTCTIDTSNVVTCVLPTGVDHDGKPLYLTDNVLVNGQPNPNNYVFAKQSIRDMYPFEHVYHLECEDATEGSEEADDKKNKYTPTKAKVRERMLDQALEVLWEDKAHHGDNDQPSANTMPTVSLQVQFVTLGDTEEYKQFKDLERLFLYDKVRVKVPKLNIDMLLDAVRVKTDCLTGHTVEVEIGAVQDIEVSVPSWAITSLNGGKIVSGSIPAGSFGPGVITADAIFSNAITTHHLAADSVTADKIKAGEITADKLSAEIGEFETLITNNLTAETVHTKMITAGEGYFDDVVAANISTAVLDAGQITTGYIDANLIEAGSITVGKLEGDYGSFNDLVVTNIQAGDLSADTIDATTISTSNMAAYVATIDQGYINNAMIQYAHIDSAQMTTADVQSLTAAMLTADKASLAEAGISVADINSLYAAYAAVADAQIAIAHIDFADITQAQVEDLSAYFAHIDSGKITNVYASGIYTDASESQTLATNTGFLNTAVIEDGSITSAKIISLNADVITAGTLSVDRLIIRGTVARVGEAIVGESIITASETDNLMYRINAAAYAAGEITATQLSDAEYTQHMHGANIVARSVTADQIKAQTITGTEIHSDAIDTIHIKAGAVTTTKVESNFGYSLDISSNVAITQLAGDIESDHSLIAENANGITLLNTTTGNQAAWIEIADGRISANASGIEDINDTLTPYKAWMKFDASNYLTIGNDSSPFSVQVTNTALNFMNGTNPVAWVNNENFYISDGKIDNSLVIGRYKFIPQSNGNLSIVYNS